MKMKVLKVHPNDNVIVALQNLEAGEEIDFNEGKIFNYSKIYLRSINLQKRISIKVNSSPCTV